MELKAIIGIALVVFIVGGFIFLQIRNRKKKVRTSAGRGLKTPPLLLFWEAYNEKPEND